MYYIFRPGQILLASSWKRLTIVPPNKDSLKISIDSFSYESTPYFKSEVQKR